MMLLRRFLGMRLGVGVVLLIGRRLRGAVTACLSLALVLAIGTTAPAQLDVETKLTAKDDAGNGDQFGFSAAISGNTAIVGAVLNDDACPTIPFSCQSGSAYLLGFRQQPRENLR